MNGEQRFQISTLTETVIPVA